MMGTRNRVGTFLCAACFLCLVGVCIAGLLSTEGNVWETLTIVCAFGMLASAMACLGFVIVAVRRFRNERKEIRIRPTLSDEEFTARLGLAEKIDLRVVKEVRELAAKRFRSIHGDKFYPEDLFEDDLHFSDSLLFGTEHFRQDLMEFLGIAEDEPAPEFENVTTYGDLIVAANCVWRRKHSSAKSSTAS